MKSLDRVLCAAALLGLANLACATEPQKQGRKAAPVLCAQTQMIGNAGDDFATAAACATAIAANPVGALRAAAASDGKDQCKRYCDAMGCTAKTNPDPLRSTAGPCKRPDPAAATWYGTATTGQFDCKCNNP